MTIGCCKDPIGEQLKPPPARFASRHLSEWLQRHAFELVEVDDRIDPLAARPLEAQARRLGIPVLRAGIGVDMQAAGREAAMISLHSFAGEPQ